MNLTYEHHCHQKHHSVGWPNHPNGQKTDTVVQLQLGDQPRKNVDIFFVALLKVYLSLNSFDRKYASAFPNAVSKEKYIRSILFNIVKFSILPSLHAITPDREAPI